MNKIKSKKKTKNIFIGVAWPYANNNLHIGHLAGCYLGADIFARFQRLIGNSVLMVSGSDCFGTPVCLKAEEEGVSIKEITERYHANHQRCFLKADIIFDNYTTTTTDIHKKTVQSLFLKLFEKGYIFKKTTKEFFSKEEKRFLPDTYVFGQCPICKAENVKSNQCEQCGSIDLSKKLINPRSKINNSPVSLKETEHYFLDWSKLQPFLERYFQEKSPYWREWIKNETKGWLKKGLEPRAITRDIEHGVDLPIEKISQNKLLKDIEKKRIYVWFEAVIGYLSASIEWAERNGTTPSSFTTYSKKKWQDFWYDKNDNNDIEHYYFMGKDNLVFHTLFWPGQLSVYCERSEQQGSGAKRTGSYCEQSEQQGSGAKRTGSYCEQSEQQGSCQRQGSYDKDIHLPDKVIINHFLNYKDKKLSKSEGQLIEAEKLIDDYGSEAVRFYLISVMPENSDSNFSWEDFKDKHNNVLIGNFGNFVNRILSLSKELNFNKDILIEDEIKETTEQCFKNAKNYLDKVELKNYIKETLKLSDKGNKYLEKREPWKQKKEDQASFLKTMFNALYLLMALTLLMKPTLPRTTLKIEKMIGIKFDKWPDEKSLSTFIIENIKKIKIKEIIPIFKKIEY